jgi:uncharacterized protein YndB with AHSA1/START domain
VHILNRIGKRPIQRSSSVPRSNASARPTYCTTVTKTLCCSVRSCLCKHGNGFIIAMSIQTSTREKLVQQLDVDRIQRSVELWNVESRVSVGADKTRIFQALTVPEYMETWLSFPGRGARMLIASSLTPNEYRIDQYAPSGPVQKISGCYRVLRRSKLIFTWIKDGWLPSQSSVVWLRLIGDFSRTTVSLHHVSLPSREEQQWHQQLWDASLAKLSSLFTTTFRFAN